MTSLSPPQPQMRTALEAYERLSRNYISRNSRSQSLYNHATTSLPGGNTRTSLYYPPFPLSIVSANGSRIHSADGDTYVDLLGEFTAGLYGHSDPVIAAAMISALSQGLNYGGQHSNEARLAELIRERFPSMDLVRFTNSGTEATIMALALAKVYGRRKGEQRSKVLVFYGSYHGAIFMFSAGEPSESTASFGEYLVARYNDLDSVNELLYKPENMGRVAAILVEAGMVGSGGAIPARKSFLEGLRRCADESGAVLIFDEVMTSRLYEGGGAQSRLPKSYWPDLTTLGKYIGGGSSFGAFGGKRQIMELLDPRRADAIGHAGTFNNNVITMAAGIAGLTQVFTPTRAAALHEAGEKLRARLNEIGRGTLLKVTGCGSIMCFHWTEIGVEDIRSPLDLAHENSTLRGLLHLFLLEKGYHIARRGFIALNLGLTSSELEGFTEAVEMFVQQYRPILEIRNTTSKL